MVRPWRVVVSGVLAVAWAAMLALADVFDSKSEREGLRRAATRAAWRLRHCCS